MSKSSSLHIRITADEKSRYESAAESCGLKVSAWARGILDFAARNAELQTAGTLPAQFPYTNYTLMHSSDCQIDIGDSNPTISDPAKHADRWNWLAILLILESIAIWGLILYRN